MMRMIYVVKYVKVSFINACKNSILRTRVSVMASWFWNLWCKVGARWALCLDSTWAALARLGWLYFGLFLPIGFLICAKTKRCKVGAPHVVEPLNLTRLFEWYMIHLYLKIYIHLKYMCYNETRLCAQSLQCDLLCHNFEFLDMVQSSIIRLSHCSYDTLGQPKCHILEVINAYVTISHMYNSIVNM